MWLREVWKRTQSIKVRPSSISKLVPSKTSLNDKSVVDGGRADFSDIVLNLQSNKDILSIIGS